jgi:hypothetical protein
MAYSIYLQTSPSSRHNKIQWGKFKHNSILSVLFMIYIIRIVCMYNLLLYGMYLIVRYSTVVAGVGEEIKHFIFHLYYFGITYTE